MITDLRICVLAPTLEDGRRYAFANFDVTHNDARMFYVKGGRLLRTRNEVHICTKREELVGQIFDRLYVVSGSSGKSVPGELVTIAQTRMRT